ncbi:MAG: TRZ/ATZ family protein [Candidatus Omnitrophica bacterium]|nr:TRZ/ATZ family protein [Candidatus Omnitrophota bacterium]
MKRISAPLQKDQIKDLKPGEEVLLAGTVYTARDQAHKRMALALEKKEALPLELDGQVIFYCGPTPPGERVIGSCGPTTSSRMDPFTPAILRAGVKGLIGKGKRSPEVARAIKEKGAVYFIAPGGAGAYLSERVRQSRVVAFEGLGTEAIYMLEVEDFPLVVGIDSQGRDIYAKEEGEQ